MVEKIKERNKKMAKVVADMGPVIRAVKQAGQSIDQVQEMITDVHESVFQTDHNVQTLLMEIKELTTAFHAFSHSMTLSRRQEAAMAKLAELKETARVQFGGYEEVRRIMTEVLKLMEEGETKAYGALLKKWNETEPDYWLSPCLRVVSAWVQNKPEEAEAAIQQALHRDKGKATLFFLLLNYKANRPAAALAWLSPYIEGLNTHALDSNAAIILEAFRLNGFGPDVSGDIEAQIMQWARQLDFTAHWTVHFQSLSESMDPGAYFYLQKYSPTWGAIKNAVEAAFLHKTIYEHVHALLSEGAEKEDTGNEEAQLPDFETPLRKLIDELDKAEAPIHGQIQYEQRVIDCGGDEQQASFSVAKPDRHTPARQLFTALTPLALALNKDRLLAAYEQLTDPVKIPVDIIITHEDFSMSTTDGSNEMHILDKYYRMIEGEKNQALSDIKLTLKERLTRNQKRLEAVEEAYETQREKGVAILRGLMAEVRDVREILAQAEAEREKTTALLSGITLAPPLPKPTRGRKPKPAVPVFAKKLAKWDVLPLVSL